MQLSWKVVQTSFFRVLTHQLTTKSSAQSKAVKHDKIIMRKGWNSSWLCHNSVIRRKQHRDRVVLRRMETASGKLHLHLPSICPSRQSITRPASFFFWLCVFLFSYVKMKKKIVFLLCCIVDFVVWILCSLDLVWDVEGSKLRRKICNCEYRCW